MAIIYADQVSELAIKATVGGKQAVTVLHFYNDESALSDAAKAKDILNNWQDHVVPLLANGYVLQGADWRSLDRNDNNAGSLTLDTAKPTFGSVAVPMQPPNVCFLATKVRSNRGRGQRNGRIFLGRVPENVVDESGTLAPTTVDAHNTAWAAFIGGVNDDTFGVGGGSGLVVLNTTAASRVPGTQEVDLTFGTVTSIVCDPVVSTQRDRLR